MKFKVGDKVKFIPHYSLTNKSRIAIVKAVYNDGYCRARIKYTQWLEIQVRQSELTLLSPVEAILYDWNEDVQSEEKD